MEQTNQLIREIIQGACDNIPSTTWDSLSITIKALNKMIEIGAFCEEGGKMLSFDPEENGNDITMKIKSLREQMYRLSPGNGAWYSAYFTVDNTGKFQTEFDYDNKPEFEYTPSNEKFIDDLKTFPRNEALIPQWLHDLVGS
ncbi:immunity protein YezG family protein [Chitinophaga sp. ARDCPP14]|uniref:immunity protein YezG family protein n=1 Tax=Chitinophaga sp. ARDCPP14 TaxID=3391139 RepID=UPI003F520EF5